MKRIVLPVFASLLFLTTFSPIKAASASCLDPFRSFSPIQLQVHSQIGRTDYSPVAAWYTNSRCLIVGSTTGLWLYDLAQPDKPIRLATPGNITNVDVNPTNLTIAFNVDEESIVHLIKADGTTSSISASGQDVTALSFSPDGNLIAAGSENFLNDANESGLLIDPRVQVWDSSHTDRNSITVSDEDDIVRGLFFNSDTNHLLIDTIHAGYGDDEVYYWDLATSAQVWSYEDLFRSITKWSPNDPLDAYIAVMHDHNVAFGGLDGYMNDNNYYGSGIHIWNAETKVRTQQIVVSTEGCYCDADQFMAIAFNSDGSEIVSSQYDGTIKLWNVADGKQIGEFDSGLKAPQISFSPDDRFLALQASNQIVIWDTASQKTYTSLQVGS